MLFLALGWAFLQLRVDYVLLTPGPAVDVAPMISIEGTPGRPAGSILLTTVISDMDTTVPELIQSKLTGRGEAMPKREFIPPSMSMEEYNRAIMEMMEESKTVAKIAALRQMGYQVDATGEGALVQALLPGTLAEGILREGDVLVEVDGQQIHAAPDLVNLVRRLKPGSMVSVKALRNNDLFETRVSTRESDTEPGIAVIGILVKTHKFGSNLPVQIEIDSQNIGGPSAGLMFTLGIMDAMEGHVITAGHKVAGTGTISLDGAVGPVGGVGPKVIGAEEAGAEYFLSPSDNYEAAKLASKRIQVVPVATLGDAVSFLKSLQPVQASPSVLSGPFELSLPAAA